MSTSSTLREAAKRIVFAACLLVLLPVVALSWMEKRITRSEVVFIFFAQLLALVPGLPGTLLRAAYYFGTLDRCSWQTHFGFGTHFTHRGAQIASHVSSGSYCIIGHAVIGTGVRLASRVSIPSGRRQHLDDEGKMTEATHFTEVRIGPGSWIGEGAIVLADVGSRSIVSAGAVVLAPVPDDCLAGGNPAKVLREIAR